MRSKCRCAAANTCKTAKIGRAIMDADVFISLTHFKGHESTGFGGALKNIGMGCGSRAGKMEQHAAGQARHGAAGAVPRLPPLRTGVRLNDAITYDEQNKAVIDQDKCKGCGRCIGACNFDAISFPVRQRQRDAEPQDGRVRQGRAATGRPCFHISLVHGCQPQLRLPRRKRRAHPAGYGHVRLL